MANYVLPEESQWFNSLFTIPNNDYLIYYPIVRPNSVAPSLNFHP
jgi:hypothetical protein